jgi:hypothetical protein
VDDDEDASGGGKFVIGDIGAMCLVLPMLVAAAVAVADKVSTDDDKNDDIDGDARIFS